MRRRLVKSPSVRPPSRRARSASVSAVSSTRSPPGSSATTRMCSAYGNGLSIETRTAAVPLRCSSSSSPSAAKASPATNRLAETQAMPSSLSAKRSWNERAGATWRTARRQRSKGGSSCSKLATSASLACAKAPRSDAASARSSALARATATARGLSASSSPASSSAACAALSSRCAACAASARLVREELLGVQRQVHLAHLAGARRERAAERDEILLHAAPPGARVAQPQPAGGPSGAAPRRAARPPAGRTARRAARAPRPAAPRPRRPRRRRRPARAPRRRRRT